MTDKRLSHYDEHYFIGRTNVETLAYHDKTLRPGDEWACLCYAFGISSYAEACKLLGVSQARHQKSPLKFNDQIKLAKSKMTRKPKLVVDMGAGRGELTAAFMLCGIRCIAIDPAPGAATLIPKTLAQWGNITKYEFHPYNMLEGTQFLALTKTEPDTIVMCESLEHIPETEFDLAWPIAVDLLRKSNGLFIAANWVDYHPIRPDKTGYDHIRTVDDTFYDGLAQAAQRTVFRLGSHLVLEF